MTNQPYHQPHRRTPGGTGAQPRPAQRSRVSVPSAREELDRERALYSAHEERYETATPAQRQIRQGDFASQPQGGKRIPRTGQPQPRPSVKGRIDPAASGRMPASGQRTPANANPSRSGRMPASAARKQDDDASNYSRASYTGQFAAQNHPQRTDARQKTAPRRGTAAAPRSAAGSPERNAPRPVDRNAPGVAQVRAPRLHQEGASAYGASRYKGMAAARSTRSFGPRQILIGAAAAVLVAIIGVFGFQSWADAQPIDVTLNGEQKTLQGDERSVSGLLEAGVASATPGNYVAVDGSVMRQGEGTRCTATVNDQQTDDLGQRLNAGDVITIADGTDVTESYTDSNVQTIPFSVKIQGTGAVHVYTGDGTDGEKVTRTGNESGKTAEIVTKEPSDRIVQYYNVDTHGDKVIALTFDDGPWNNNQTTEVLDILKENDAKATFFTVGERISGNEEVVKRAADEGHEIGTHTYDHAEGSGQGVSLILMSDEERKQEVQKGLDAIKNATGQEASTIFRSPGGNFDTAVATSLNGLVTAEIGWNVDTNDWRRPGADVIAQRIESAGPGNIILMHDGGGDRSQTIAGLKEALPKLKEQGYQFVTVQELLERYPHQA